jgi:hypothetical protein
MDTQYRCQNEERRRLVGATEDANGNPITPKLNGIDYLEVASADQKTLRVFFLHNLPGQPNPIPPAAPALTKSNIVIEGGARVKDIKLDSDPLAANNVLTVTVNQAGDYSTYTLRIITSPTSPDPPPGFDPQLSAVDFSFKIECPSDFDCADQAVCPPPEFVEPEIDYLAKDYSSFRRLVLDRLSTLMPDWRERHSADAQVALVEMLAYVGDHLSYFQDAVAAEAYLGTARRRISVRRQARLLDYFVHDGTNARTWVAFEVTAALDGKTLPAKSKTGDENTMVLSRGSTPEIAVTTANVAKAIAEQPVVFETLHKVALNHFHNSISFYTWSDQECCLPAGATRATLLDTGLTLTAGDVLIFEEVLSPTTGHAADADPSRRCAVRLKAVTKRKDPLDDTKVVVDIEWLAQDALPFPLCLSALIVDDSGNESVKEISVARGNIALADHGLTLTDEDLIPSDVPDEGLYRPRLRLSGITSPVAYDDAEARLEPASSLLDQDVRAALPIVTLADGSETWRAQRDLLNSDRFAPEFVVETERDGTAHLRFGDGISGKKPDEGTEFTATYRVGNGRAGNVGAEALCRVVSDLAGFQRVRNPLAAHGGIDPESMEEVRQFAPQAFRTQERAVTEADWAAIAERHPEVQKAAARFRWFGSWYTVVITIDRTGGLPVKSDEKFREDIQGFLEEFRIAGYDLEINDPVLVPLDILLRICVKTGYFQSDVKRSLTNVFSRFPLPGGARGFFHPDNFTFGQPVYLSKIYQAAMNVAGIASVEALTFQRFGKVANNEIDDARLVPASLEIIQLDNDPNFPEHGRINFEMHGGL